MWESATFFTPETRGGWKMSFSFGTPTPGLAGAMFFLGSIKVAMA